VTTQGIQTATARRWVLVLTSVASLMVALDALVVTTALPTIRRDLGASIEQLEWTVNAYGLSFAVLLMTGAALGDRFGRRRMFTAGLALFTAASAACGLAPDVGWLIAARAVQGAGAALVMPLAMAQLSAAFPPEERGKALGIFSGVAGLAVLGGPVVGGAIADGLAWEWIFWLNIPIGLATIPLVLARMPESFGPGGALDMGGVVLVTGGAFGIVWGLVRGNEAGWGSLEVLGALVAGALLALAFVAWERRVHAPMLPLRFFRSRAFSAANAAGFLLYASLYGTVFFASQFLQAARGDSPLEAGLELLPWTAMLFFVAPLAGGLVNRIGERPLVVGGLTLQAAGMAWMALVAEPGVAYSALVAPMIVAGSGVSMAMPPAQAAVMGSVAPQEIGKASGAFNTLRFLGGSFGVAILVAVFSGAGGYASAQEFADGFVPALGVAAGLSLAGAIAGTALTAGKLVQSADGSSLRDDRRLDGQPG
jgi:EmrB/QacA subfamily drug resistance transporter